MSELEVEIRSFLTQEKFDYLIELFKKIAVFVNKDYQETYYLNSETDLRIQKNNLCSKIILKKGELHDEIREELEIEVNRDDFGKLENLFANLGFKVKLKFLRTRYQFNWENIFVFLDNTKGFGYVIELEKKSTEEHKEKDLEMLKHKLKLLNIDLTPKEEFTKKFKEYEKNWKNLI